MNASEALYSSPTVKKIHQLYSTKFIPTDVNVTKRKLASYRDDYLFSIFEKASRIWDNYDLTAVLLYFIRPQSYDQIAFHNVPLTIDMLDAFQDFIMKLRELDIMITLYLESEKDRHLFTLIQEQLERDLPDWLMQRQLLVTRYHLSLPFDEKCKPEFQARSEKKIYKLKK